MRALTRCLWVLLPVIATCGGSSSKSSDGGASGDTCANLACLQQMLDLMVACSGGGCIASTDPSAPIITTCFGNGVKVLRTFEESTGTTEVTSTTTYRLKKNDEVCYTRTSVDHASPTSGAFYLEDVTTQDGAGTTLVTATVDANDVVTVTCPGRAPAVWTAECGFYRFLATGPYMVEGNNLPLCADQSCTF